MPRRHQHHARLNCPARTRTTILAGSVGSAQIGAGPLTIAYTVSQAASELVLAVGCDQASPTTNPVTGATWQGPSGAPIALTQVFHNSDGTRGLYLFHLPNPQPGSGSVVIGGGVNLRAYVADIKWGALLASAAASADTLISLTTSATGLVLAVVDAAGTITLSPAPAATVITLVAGARYLARYAGTGSTLSLTPSGSNNWLGGFSFG